MSLHGNSWLHLAILHRSGPQYLYRCWLVREISYSKNSLGCSFWAPERPPFSDQTRSSIACCISRAVSAGLRKHDHGQHSFYFLVQVQSVANAAAWLIYSSSRYKHVTLQLCQRHWLKGPRWIDFKLTVLVYQCLHVLTPAYLADELQRAVNSEARQRLRSFISSSLIVRHTCLLTAHFRLLLLVSETVCVSASPQRLHYQSSELIWRPMSSHYISDITVKYSLGDCCRFGCFDGSFIRS